MKRTLAGLVLGLVLAATSVAAADTIANATGRVDPTQTRYSGLVTDITGRPVVGACVFAGPSPVCPEWSIYTDENGYWAVDLPTGLEWDFHIVREGYPTVTLHADPPTSGKGPFRIYEMHSTTTLLPQ